MTAYRFHVARNPNRDDPRPVTLCGKDFPDTYVFNEPVEGQPMCSKCVERWKKKTAVHSQTAGQEDT